MAQVQWETGVAPRWKNVALAHYRLISDQEEAKSKLVNALTESVTARLQWLEIAEKALEEARAPLRQSP